MMYDGIKLTSSNSGKELYVNSSAIEMIQSRNDGSRIYTNGGTFIDVKETPEKINELSNELRDNIFKCMVDLFGNNR